MSEVEVYSAHTHTYSGVPWAPRVLPHTSHKDQVTASNHTLAFIASGERVKHIHDVINLFTT